MAVYQANVVVTSTPGAVALFEQGATFPAVLVGPAGQVNVDAEIDTGSTVSGADLSLLQQVGAVLSPNTPPVPVQTPSGNAMDSLYSASLVVGNGDLWAGIPGVLGEDLPSGQRVLVGRDVLSTGTLYYDGRSGSWTFTGTAGPAPAVAQGVSPWVWGAALVALGAGLMAYEDESRGRRAA